MSQNNLMWFRNDLRVHDNPALSAAMQAGTTEAIYFWCPDQWQSHNLSDARMGLTIDALQDLNVSLAQIGVKLTVMTTPGFKEIPALLEKFFSKEKIKAVFANAEYALDERVRDRSVRAVCRANEVSWHPHHGTIMQIPDTLKTGQGNPYKVFTPFKKAWMKSWPEVGRSVQPKPKSHGAIEPSRLDLPDISYSPGLFPTTEAQAIARLKEFADERMADYKEQRDTPSVEGTSRLSAALVVGLVSPVQCLNAAMNAAEWDLEGNPGINTWVSELIWREFYLNVIYCWPNICKGKAFRPETDQVAWRYDEADFTAWCQGETGFPIVDAAMKQLNETGWMHNRLRMVTAMFLSKYLLIDWRWGEAYFMRHLIDGHFASNNGGWQWSSSTGTDAAPYFRVLSPTRQAERFDVDGAFVRHYLPQLKNVPSKALLKPGSPELLAAGYPAPIIDLRIARESCLSAFKSIRAYA